MQSAPKPQGGRPESGINAASRELGIEATDASRAVKVASLTTSSFPTFGPFSAASLKFVFAYVPVLIFFQVAKYDVFPTTPGKL